MYKYYTNRIIVFFTIVMIILCTSSLSAQYISGPTTVTLGQYAEYYFEGATSDQVASASWSVDYGSIQNQNSGVNYVSVLYSYVGTNYINVDYFNGFYWDQVYLQVEVVDSSVATPILSVTQPSCTNSRGSFSITNYNHSYNYSVSPSNGVEIGGSVITAPVGSYTVTATSGAYTSSPSAIVTLNAQPATPAAPTVGSITQPTDQIPTGSVVLSNLPGSGTWIINPGSISGTGTTKTVTGLPHETTYNFTVTNASGCVSSSSAPVVIDIEPSGIRKPALSSVIQPSCTKNTGSFTITNYNASYTYSSNPSAGVFITGNTVTAPTGSYIILAASGGISSSPSASVTVNTQPATPATPIVGTITQPTAASAGSVVLSNLPSNGSWIINPGNISGNGSTVTIAGLAPSVQPYKFTVTNSLSCVSGSSADVGINGYCGISDENYVHTITPTIASTDISTLSNSQKIEGITYYDGLGRPIQKIDIRAGEVINDITKTMVLSDIINPIEYDEFGRQTKEYLPYTDTFNCGTFRGTTLMNSIVAGFYNTNKYENTLNPYSEKQFEASPLNRVLEQAAPGNDWKLGGGHEIKMSYQRNQTNEVKNYGVSLAFANNTYAPTLTKSSINNGYYNENELYKTVTYDENTDANPTDEKKGSTVEFKNKKGQVVLKRTYGIVENGTSNEAHDTYYVYDDFGNLAFVIPPKAADNININSLSNIQANLPYSGTVPSGTTLALTATNSITLTNFYAPAGTTFSAKIVPGGNTTLDELCYQYKYDQRNRLVEKKLPGKQWEFIVYDKLDRVVAIGPALSPFNDTAVNAAGWMITKYDVFSRPVYTGWEQSATPITSAERITKQNNQNAAAAFNESKQTSGTIDGITVYYSNNVVPASFKLLTVNYYDNYTFPGVATVPTTVETQSVLTTAAQTKGLATGSWMRIPRAISGTQAEIATIFYDKKARPVRTYSTNFVGGYTNKDLKLDFTGKPEYTITYHKRLSSDAELKIKEDFSYSPQGRLLTQTHQINDGAVELIASNTYDELGQLVSKKVGDNVTTPTQKVDYAYNIRGWLKGINNISSLQQGTDPKDLFAFKINYNTIPSGIPDVKALYNGNIAETQWATNSDNGVLRTYGYKYDNLNRLRAGIYKKGTVLDMYNESLTYDKNGNIMSLIRNGNSESTVTQIDNLTYSYGALNQHNQLTKVIDSKSNTAGLLEEFKDNGSTTDDYSYDANGNMIKDNNKNISQITYNHLNLPTKITFGATGNIEYIYNAEGQKLEKVVTQGTTVTTTDYLGGYQYLKPHTGTWALQFLPTAEGYVEPSGGSYKYVYQYKDHLGNVRLSYDKNLAIQEESNYYPFGLKHAGYNIVSIPSGYKYRYNGKEMQDENIGGSQLNLYDYGARNYDPAIGRWMNIDPKAETSRRFSPYTYALNNPIYFIDPDGMQADDWKDKDGKVIEGDALKNVKVYIFHDDNFSEQAMTQYNEAVKKYGEGAVALSNTGTTEGFAKDWGNMDGTPAEVDIMTHGKNQSINVNTETNAQFTATGNGKTNVSGTEAPNVQDLPKPKATLASATLNMYSCHSSDSEPKAHGEGDHAQGDLKGSGKPIAQVFSETFGFKKTFGTAGSVNYNSFGTNLTLPSSSNYMKPYPENGHWLYYTPLAPANTVKR